MVETSTGQRSFAYHEPPVWNSLPSTLRDSSLSLRLLVLVLVLESQVLDKNTGLGLYQNCFFSVKPQILYITRNLCYRKDDRAMRAI